MPTAERTPLPGLEAFDYAVVVLYVLVTLGIVYLASRRQHNTEDYFLGNRRMPWLAVGLSIMATLLSSLTYVGLTGEVQLVDPRKEQKTDKGKGAPITITAFGNKLIVASDDPAALTLVQELVRLVTQTPGGEGDFEIIRLRHANAVEVSRVLDEAFNGPRPTGPGGGSGRSSRDGKYSRGSPGERPGRQQWPRPGDPPPAGLEPPPQRMGIPRGHAATGQTGKILPRAETRP